MGPAGRNTAQFLIAGHLRGAMPRIARKILLLPEIQHFVQRPLAIAFQKADAGLTKAEIWELSRIAELPTWDRPAPACLSSRVPYGTPVTIENVKTVENGEQEIKALGFRQFRVRFHGEVVRIENAREELEKALDAGEWRGNSRRSSRSWDSSMSRSMPSGEDLDRCP